MRSSLLASLGLGESLQRLLPATFQFGGHQTVVGVDLEKLPLGQRYLISQALQLLVLGLDDTVLRLELRGPGLGVGVEFQR